MLILVLCRIFGLVTRTILTYEMHCIDLIIYYWVLTDMAAVVDLLYLFFKEISISAEIMQRIQHHRSSPSFVHQQPIHLVL